MVPYLWVSVKKGPDSMTNEVGTYTKPMGTSYVTAAEERKKSNDSISYLLRLPESAVLHTEMSSIVLLI